MAYWRGRGTLEARERHIYARRTTEKEQTTPSSRRRIDGVKVDATIQKDQPTDAAHIHLLPRRRPAVLFGIKEEN